MRDNKRRLLREFVLKKYNNHCAYCGVDLSINTLHIDHIQPKAMNGIDNIENMNPSCKECNNYKGPLDIEMFRKCTANMMNKKLHYLFKSKTKMQLAINLGIIIINKWDEQFYFEKLN